MHIHRMSADEALASLHTGPDGLTDLEAARRLAEFGPNRVEHLPQRPLVLRFLSGLGHFFALILWVAAGLAFVAHVHDPDSGMATLGLAIIAVILINAAFSFWQEYRAERAMAELQKLLPHQVKVLRDGKVHQAPAAGLVPGDILLLDGGDDVPADCLLVEAFGVRVNTATLTGEALPRARDAEPATEDDLLHARNVLLAGTSLVAGTARAVVFATGMHTEFGKIARLTQETGPDLSPLQKEIVRLSRVIATLALALGVIFFLLGQALGLPFWHNLLFAVGIIVANVPEGLLPTVTLALALASQRMARKNALIRHLPSVEALGSATVICTDKTGTLTQNRMEVRKVFLGGQFHLAPGPGQGAWTARSDRVFFEGAGLCHSLREADGHELIGDPMEVALVAMARQALPEVPTCSLVREVPFDSERRRLATLHRTADGLVLHVKGALEALLPLCDRVQAGGEARPLTPERREEFLRAQDALAAEGLRVLAFAHRDVPMSHNSDHLEEGLIPTGLAGLHDPPRPEVPAAIATCKAAGIKVIMATGDHPHTAVAVARQIGLVEGNAPRVITGDRLRRLSDTQLRLALDTPEVIFARVAADQKTRLVAALKAKGHIVAVTGDGVNDAPALRQADIGIAMGRTGTDVAREAADMVLLDDNFASIVAAVEQGRAVFANLRKFLTYILTSNVPEIIPYLAFVLLKIPLALTVIQILAVDLGTDMLPALGLGAEPPDPETMRRPPRPRGERLLSGPLLARAYLFLGVLESLAAMAAFFFVLWQGGWHYGQVLPVSDPLYLRATTACLAAIVVTQVANVFLCRSERRSAFEKGAGTNGLLLAGVAVEIALLLLLTYTPPGNLLFGTAALPAEVWLFIVPFAAGMFVLEEFRKWLVRRASASTPGQ